MPKYKVITASYLDSMLLRHVAFLSRVSLPATKKFRNEFEEILKRLEKNPFQFPFSDDPNLPEGVYRKALFCKWYKALFCVDGNTVYLDAVVDCRMDNHVEMLSR